ncbi:SET and MYND domain-containing protein 4-like [Schistocerca americana]|uniref:SET and MYND domain-containing protein 4-like n=1 Tax=Schistocerca americana TaxID=7009 RepID=UPI001F4F6DB0|nr:SET and MYND domain-containing protein 4-like [Schistocerca americana]
MMEPIDAFYRLCECLKTDNKVEEVSKMFSSFERDSNRVSFAMELLRQYNILTLPLCLNDKKSDTIAAEYRMQGNRAYQQKDDRKALSLYNRGIAFSPVVQLADTDGDSNELSLGFANRSAVAFSLGDSASCLKDIDLAFKYRYPANLHYKLLERKGKCFLRMNRFEDAFETFTGALKALELASLPAEKCQSVKKQIIELQGKTESRNAATEKPYLFSLQQKLPRKTYQESNEIVCACDAVEIKYSQDMGRYIQASTNLNPGDVIAIERPFASVLLDDAYYTHCYNCLLRCNALIPCETCSMVMFCSDECRNEALEKSHSVDCSILAPLTRYGIDKMGMLAVRIILTAAAYGKKLNELISEIRSFEMETSADKRTKGFSKDGKYHSDEYTTIYHLVGNTDKRTVGDLFKRAVNAACILHCFEEYSDFFNPENTSSYKQLPDSGKNKGSEGHQNPQDFQKEAKLIVGGLLLRHLQNLPCNAHEVSEFIHISAVTQNKERFDLDMIEMGAAAYSFLSLINHSCDPNVVRNSHCGSTAVLRVIKPIKKGEQVFDNYGYHYATHSLEERQLHLRSQYFFTCMCEPCTGNWPLYVSLPSAQLLLKCTHCSTVLEDNFPTNPSEGNLVTCTMCKGVNDVVKRKKVLMESSDRFMENISAVLRGHTEGVATSLVTHLTLLHENVLRPWKEYNDCQEALKQCFNFLGNCYTI